MEQLKFLLDLFLHLDEYLANIIIEAWVILQPDRDLTPTGSRRIPIHPLPGELSDRAKSALDYIQSRIVWDQDRFPKKE